MYRHRRPTASARGRVRHGWSEPDPATPTAPPWRERERGRFSASRPVPRPPEERRSALLASLVRRSALRFLPAFGPFFTTGGSHDSDSRFRSGIIDARRGARNGANRGTSAWPANCSRPRRAPYVSTAGSANASTPTSTADSPTCPWMNCWPASSIGRASSPGSASTSASGCTPPAWHISTRATRRCGR